MSILLSYPKPHPSLWKNRVRGGSLSLSKNMDLSDDCDFPNENIRYFTPYFEGGALVYFVTREQNRNCHMYADMQAKQTWNTINRSRTTTRSLNFIGASHNSKLKVACFFPCIAIICVCMVYVVMCFIRLIWRCDVMCVYVRALCACAVMWLYTIVNVRVRFFVFMCFVSGFVVCVYTYY